jgi:hypothetical protein
LLYGGCRRLNLLTATIDGRFKKTDLGTRDALFILVLFLSCEA